MLRHLFDTPSRSVFYVENTHPASYYLVDKEVDGVLVNSPVFSDELLTALNAIAPLKYIYLTSRRGAQDLDQWRETSGAESLCYQTEARHIDGTIDLEADNKRKFTRTMDFMPMGGATEGTCALRCKNIPSIVFFGPALELDNDGWPTLKFHDDDYSAENKIFGGLGIQDVTFEYALTDTFTDNCQWGPGAGEIVKEKVNNSLMS